MKKINLLLFLLLTISFGFCTTEPDTKTYTEYKIKVDSISLAKTVALTDTLTIKFHGIVGSNGCCKFDHFELHKKPNEIHFTLWGKKPSDGAICPAEMVYLDEKEYKTKFEQTGNYKIFINQPDNSVLVYSVNVQ